jgi:hypothetical protein
MAITAVRHNAPRNQARAIRRLNFADAFLATAASMLFMVAVVMVVVLISRVDLQLGTQNMTAVGYHHDQIFGDGTMVQLWVVLTAVAFAGSCGPAYYAFLRESESAATPDDVAAIGARAQEHFGAAMLVMTYALAMCALVWFVTVVASS